MTAATKLETVDETWLTYMDQVIPRDAPQVQIQECKRAFYAGAAAMFYNSAAIGNDDVTEDRAVAHLEQVGAELKRFSADVEAGRE
jgi:hypothetical protein